MTSLPGRNFNVAGFGVASVWINIVITSLPSSVIAYMRGHVHDKQDGISLVLYFDQFSGKGTIQHVLYSFLHIQFSGENTIHRIADGHGHAEILRQMADGIRGADALGH